MKENKEIALTLYLRYDFFNWTKKGVKHIEYRKYSENIENLKKGDIVKFLEIDKNGDRTGKKLYVEVEKAILLRKLDVMRTILNIKDNVYENLLNYYKKLYSFLVFYYKDLKDLDIVSVFYFKVVE